MPFWWLIELTAIFAVTRTDMGPDDDARMGERPMTKEPDERTTERVFEDIADQMEHLIPWPLQAAVVLLVGCIVVYGC